MTKVTPDIEAEIARLVADGLTHQAIGEALDLSRQTISRTHQRLGLPRRAHGGQGDPIRDAEIARRYWLGETYEQIADAIGFSTIGVFLARKRLGLPSREAKRIGTEHDAEILRLWSDGLTTVQVAEAVGVGSAVVTKTLRRLSAPQRRQSRLPEAQAARDAAITALWSDRAYRVKDIAAALRMGKGAVTAAARRLGLPQRTRGRRAHS